MKTPLFVLEGDTPRLLGATCISCGYKWFPAVFFGCEQCGSYGDDLVPREFAAVGRLLALADARQGEDSFTLAVIELKEGPVLGGIVDGGGKPHIGDIVRAWAVQSDAGAVIRFRKGKDEIDP